jgi:RNase adapter protein RapZ
MMTLSSPATPPSTPHDIVLITGISGSGKSVALHALEDAGFFCVDNLPPELLGALIRVQTGHGVSRMAIAVDVRTAGSLPQLLPVLEQLRTDGVAVRTLFLDANTPSLIKRFSETRRPHPLSKPSADGETDHRALLEAIDLERQLLTDVREQATVLDTSQLRPAQLRLWVRDLVGRTASRLTLVFQSFAFKHGVPLDADLVFDVRVLPNPFYVRELRPLTGRDQPVADYLCAQPEVADMVAQIQHFIQRWLPAYADDQRSYLTVAIGCTGGQHRSVYCAEALAQAFQAQVATLLRHRELDARS